MIAAVGGLGDSLPGPVVSPNLPRLLPLGQLQIHDPLVSSMTLLALQRSKTLSVLHVSTLKFWTCCRYSELLEEVKLTRV